ncbi:MAG: GNAT family N-acetyltransferase [Candidatus Nitrosoabyssus spongiisocia]|nr:MAG: GNAT family N-acetyltransferase [Nitrosopumilaceae archaeon AB1(1)]
MNHNKIDKIDLKIRELNNSDNLQSLDLTESNKSNPLSVNDFFHSSKVQNFQKNNLASTWVVYYNNTLVGCFSLSMSVIRKNELNDSEIVHEAEYIKTYPAILLGQFGVDKKFRSMGIGSHIIQYITGLALMIGKKIACRYIVLQTDLDHISIYNQFNFKSSKKSNQRLIWMYKKL